MVTDFGESELEQICLEYFTELGWEVRSGVAVAPDGEEAQRISYRDVLLRERLRSAAAQLNPDLPAEVVTDALARLQRAESADLLEENFRLYSYVTGGIPVEYRDPATTTPRTGVVRLVDFDDPLGNDFLAVNQFSVEHDGRTYRADIVAFVNGLPLAVFELKSPGRERAGLPDAWRQLATYTEGIPALFVPNMVCVISDGMQARMGAIGGPYEHYAPWKTIDGQEAGPPDMPELEVLIRGVFDPERFLELARDFVAFLKPRGRLVKKVAKYHQFNAVRKAVQAVVRAFHSPDDKRAGVVWHTQGSGKSLEMLFCTAKLLRHPELSNPTVVLVTDRIDLDDQLHDDTFAPALTLPVPPVQVASREDLRELLRTRASGGVILTTMQKFGRTKPELDAGQHYPMLSTRENVIVIADEAHRTQYDLKDGLASNLRDALPKAALLAFTGTPIALADRDTRRVFGGYVDIYDVTRSVRDQATVPIYYEARLARVELPEAARAELDEEFARLTQGTEEEVRDQLKNRWTRMEAVIGSEKRLAELANDIVQHWEARSAQLAGKAMIVCFSRRICVRLYEYIRRLRPDWHSDEATRGRVKVVITGNASEGPEYAQHLRTKRQLRALQERAKDLDDPLELIIVRDMWLTGFDSPPLHTMYVDKPMQGAGLMQAIARVNRRFRDKPSGLVVDYIGIATSLRDALAEYSARDREQVGVPIDVARMRLQEEYEILRQLLHGCPWQEILDSASPRARLDALATAVDFLLGGGLDREGDLVERFRQHVRAADQAFSLCPQDPLALGFRHDLAFFDAVAAQLAKARSSDQTGDQAAIELALRQVVDQAIATDSVVDIYAEAGIPKPDISIIDEQFAARLATSPYKHLQVEALRRMLDREIQQLGRRNAIAERRFSERLADTLQRYRNRTLTAAEVIAELIAYAGELLAERERGVRLSLTDAELAFYDAVRTNGSALQEFGDKTLRAIAHDLVVTVQRSTSLDWQRKEQVRARLRRNVRRLLARYGYPPDQTEDAVSRVVEQAERMASAQTEGPEA